MKDLIIRRYEDSDRELVKKLHRQALEEAGAFAESGIWDEDLDAIPEVYLKDG